MDVAGVSVPINGPVPIPDDIEAVFEEHRLMVARRASTLGRFQRLPAVAAMREHRPSLML
jgi:hypothetical protein